MKHAHKEVSRLGHRMNITLPDELDFRLRTYAAWVGKSKAEVIRRALTDYLGRQDRVTVEDNQVTVRTEEA